MITVAQIIYVSRIPFLQEMCRMEYMFGDPYLFGNGYICVLSDSKSDKSVPMCWTERENRVGTEEDKVEFTATLMRNAVRVLDVLKGLEVPDDDEAED